MPKFDLSFSLPLMNASGMLGFAPELRGSVDLSQLGAFVTNPISQSPRTPAHGERCLTYPGGFLLHAGFPNLGFNVVLRHQSPRWGRSPIPLIVHLLGQGPDDLAAMARRLEAVPGVMGLELGFPKEAGVELVKAFVRAVQGELPVIARVPMEQAIELAPAALAEGAAAVSLGPPRGALPQAGGGMTQGRLYGPALFPLALSVVRTLAQAGARVIGAGGVYFAAQVQAMLAAGALAVQLDAVLWRSPRLLLGDAVNIAPAEQDLARQDGDHFTLGK